MSTETLTPTETLVSYVTAGAARLDLLAPGWRERVTHPVESACNEHSVTGQLFGPSISGQMEAVGIVITPETMAVEGGFDLLTEFAQMGFAVLRRELGEPPAIAVMMARATGYEGPLPPWFEERPADVMAMEESTLTLLWEREVANG